ncbi:MAG: GTPase HflX [Alphaproteobacteria bacterium]|nr:GTPase HflX [Alphaproteobacteria bacterium]
MRDARSRLDEAAGLAEALDLVVAAADVVPVRRIAPGAFFGAGRVEEIKARVEDLRAGVVIVDTSLSPVQQRNLERGIGAKVVDRTGLILEIFGRRARTREGRLQVELARQAYEKSRLVRTWTHLERQRGGLGKTGGPGETQLELDRRIIGARIDRLKADLEEVRRTRNLQRSARKRAGLPTVVLVGYTNAGKSSLFNRLTEAGVLAKDMPFATLDPTARLVRAADHRPFILSDTVGFITDLPHELVEAFRATLEEVSTADVLVHVRDVAHPETEAQKQDVETVLAQLRAQEGGASASAAQPILIEAWNKTDLLPPDRRAARLARADGEGGREGGPDGPRVVAISALTGDGVADLVAAIDRAAYGPTQTVQVRLDPADGRTRAWIAARGRVVEETFDEDGSVSLTAELAADASAQLADMLGRAAERRAAE